MGQGKVAMRWRTFPLDNEQLNIFITDYIVSSNPLMFVIIYMVYWFKSPGKF
jgi:hypothetical protein